MTFEEAKKILKKEMVISFHSTKPFVFDESGWIEHEKPSVLEAFRVLAKGGYYISISGHDYNMREKRLKKEYEKNTKAPNPAKNLIKGNFPGNKSIKYCGDSMPGPGEEQPKEGNPALEEAASQFNDALLNEQGKKIKHLTKKISRLNKIIHKKNEELRLTKIREKNLAELGLKYVGENEKLKKKLADKIVDEIDAQALKSAESALAYKEKVIAEKDEVIADLGNELAATKKELEEKTHLVDIIRNASKEYCDYGVAANEFIKELASLYVLVKNNGTINDEMLERCKNYQTYGFPANCNRETKKEINDIARGNENKKLSLFRDYSVGAVTNQKDCSSAKDTHPAVDIAEEGADRSGVIVLCGKDFVKKYKEIIEELSKVADDIIDQFLLFGEIIIKEEK